jgi:HTH-type transcriptional regulator / antitoxin HigA
VPSGKKPATANRKVETIRSDDDLADATRELCALMSKTARSDAEERRFQHLVSIIEAYEDVHYPIPEPSHQALLEHLLAAKPGGIKALSEATGVAVSDIEAILRGQRQVRPQEAEGFAAYFCVEPSVFEPE